jgi:hypothetical protein
MAVMDEKTRTAVTLLDGGSPTKNRRDQEVRHTMPSLIVVDGGTVERVSDERAVLTHVDAHTPVLESCAICGAEVAALYVSLDWGSGREAICGRACADTLLDALDAFLQN